MWASAIRRPEVIRPSVMRIPLIHAIRRCGLTSGLKVCMDAGDAASYSGSGQYWYDLSGSGHHYFRGSTGAEEPSWDPPFNGTPGTLSSQNYWSFGGPNTHFFTPSTSQTWATNWHKDNAKWSAAFWYYNPASPTVDRIMGTSGSWAAGFQYQVQTPNEQLQLLVCNGVAGGAGTFQSSMAVPTNRWSMIGTAFNEAGGAGASAHFINDSVSPFNGALSTPSATNPENVLFLAAIPNITLTAGASICMVAFWDGVALTHSQWLALFNRMRPRFGV